MLTPTPLPTIEQSPHRGCHDALWLDAGTKEWHALATMHAYQNVHKAEQCAKRSGIIQKQCSCAAFTQAAFKESA